MSVFIKIMPLIVGLGMMASGGSAIYQHTLGEAFRPGFLLIIVPAVAVVLAGGYIIGRGLADLKS